MIGITRPNRSCGLISWLLACGLANLTAGTSPLFASHAQQPNLIPLPAVDEPVELPRPIEVRPAESRTVAPPRVGSRNVIRLVGTAQDDAQDGAGDKPAAAAADPAPQPPADPLDPDDLASELGRPLASLKGGCGGCSHCRRESCCDPCCVSVPCCYGDRFWIRADYLSWWTRGANLPPLITTSVPGTSLANAGVLGLPTTSLVYGNQAVSDGQRNGARIRFGGWTDACHRFGFGVEWFILGDEADTFSINSDQNPILARPFFNTQTGMQDRQINAFPNALTGSKSVTTTSDLVGAAPYLVSNLGQCCWCCEIPSGPGGEVMAVRSSRRFDLTYGYRFLRLDDDVNFQETLVVVDPAILGVPLVAGTTLDVTDRFRTENTFHGGELGLSALYTRSRWSLNLLTRLALGNTHQKISISGTTVVTVPGQAPVTNQGGLLALSTNSGTFTRDTFSLIPYLGATVGYQLTERLQLRAGYDLFWWTNVVRAAEQIDPTINPTQFPQNGPFVGPARPAVPFEEQDLWVQGVHLGVQYVF